MKMRDALCFMALSSLQLSLGDARVAISQESLPIDEPLEGVSAELDNLQELRTANTSFQDSLTGVENVLISEGLRRTTNGAGEVLRLQSGPQLEDAIQVLQQCKNNCVDRQDSCTDRADKTTSALLGVHCELSIGQCKLGCTRTFMSTIESIRDVSMTRAGESLMASRLVEQEKIAKLGIFLQKIRSANLVGQESLIQLQNVALEELIRVNLEHYREYGVPPGPTRTAVAVQDAFNCADDVREQDQECLDEVEISPDSESLLEALFVSATCLAVSELKLVGCARDTACRALPIPRFACPD